MDRLQSPMDLTGSPKPPHRPWSIAEWAYWRRRDRRRATVVATTQYQTGPPPGWLLGVPVPMPRAPRHWTGGGSEACRGGPEACRGGAKRSGRRRARRIVHAEGMRAERGVPRAAGARGGARRSYPGDRSGRPDGGPGVPR